MSYNWQNNTLGGPGSSLHGDEWSDGSMLHSNLHSMVMGQHSSSSPQYVAVSANFPPQPTKVITKGGADQLFQLSNYLTLADMTSDQGQNLQISRGGYTGEIPNRGHPAKLHATSEILSSKLYHSLYSMQKQPHDTQSMQ